MWGGCTRRCLEFNIGSYQFEIGEIKGINFSQLHCEGKKRIRPINIVASYPLTIILMLSLSLAYQYY